MAAAPLGTGARFSRLVAELRRRGGVHDPKALAASIGRKAHGKEVFQRLAAAGRHRHSDSKS